MPQSSDHEQHRLTRLRETELLDTPAEAAFDDIVKLAAAICEAPRAFVSLIDEHRQWFKSAHGFEPKETPREYSFCTHVVAAGKWMVVEDALQDPRFAASPLVTGEMGIRFYAGVPLEIEEGVVLGTLGVIDIVPRVLSEQQLEALQVLARQIVTEIRLRLQVRLYQQELAQRRQLIFQLQERFKERSSLYAISRILRDDTAPITDVLAGVIAEIPPALQFPDRSAARVVHGAADVRTDNYSAEGETMDIDFPTDDGVGGRLEIVLLDPADGDLAGAFLDEEHEWAQSLAGLLQSYFNRRIVRKQFLRAQRIEGIGTLAGGIAHDLNNLLSPIVIGVELLRKLNGDSRAAAVIDNIEQSARRGKELVNQVLSFAKGVEGARVAVRIPQLLQEVEAIAVNTFPGNIQFEKHIDEDTWVILGDPTQLSQVLLNLCINARDAMPGGGRLTVTVHNREIDEDYAALDPDATAGRYVVIEVADQGAGMSPEVLERAFDPFFTTKEMGQGTGLGLSTALGIIRSHGGFIHLHSEVGKGTVVKVYLPAR